MQVDSLCTTAGAPIHGPLLLTPPVFRDGRGYFLESWNATVLSAVLEADGQLATPFVQDNHSRSRSGVMRGLHYQVSPHAQGKLIRCVHGQIFDVAVDLRRSSGTFGQWCAAVLGPERHQQLWVPAGFAHGFLTLSEHAEVLYKTTDFWSPGCERAIRWDDPQLAITWPLQFLEIDAPLLGEKDGDAGLLADLAHVDLFA